MLTLPLADTVLGVVRAVVDGVEDGRLSRKLIPHPGHQSLEVLRGVPAACDAGLIGDYDGSVTESVGGAAEREDAFYKTHVFRTIEVADFVVDDAISIEKESLVRHYALPVCLDEVCCVATVTRGAIVLGGVTVRGACAWPSARAVRIERMFRMTKAGVICAMQSLAGHGAKV